jgi:hypothetical protein
MRPTVIGKRVEEPVLLPGPFQLALGKSRRDSIVNRLEGGIEREASSENFRSQVDAVGFEPTASPLQGERSTADLRAPLGGAAMRARLFE